MKKNIIKLTIIALAIFATSCEELLNGETSAEIAQSLEGNWKCEEESSLFKATEDTYQVYIYPSDTDSTLVYLSNFYQLGTEVDARARVNDHQINLISETIGDGYSVKGSGTISSNLKSITWSYFVNDGSGEEDEVTATYTLSY